MPQAADLGPDLPDASRLGLDIGARVGRRPPLHERRVPRQGEARGDRGRGGRGGEGRARGGELMIRMTLWNYTTLTDSAT